MLKRTKQQFRPREKWYTYKILIAAIETADSMTRFTLEKGLKQKQTWEEGRRRNISLEITNTV
jgi:hypothetical protein